MAFMNFLGLQFNHRASSQSGVTLLLSILVLASILAISFSIATVMFIEVRVSGDLTRTEPAWYAAETLTEESVFQQRRDPQGAAGTFNFTQNINSMKVGRTVTLLNDPIILEKVVPFSSSYSLDEKILNTKNRYRLYNPIITNPANDNPFLDGSGFGRVQVTYLDTGTTGSIHVYVCEFDPKESFDCNSKDSPNMLYKDTFVLSPGHSTPDSSYFPDLNPSLQQELIIFGDGTTGDQWVQIRSFGSSEEGYPPRGLPFFGATAVDITGDAPNISRKVRVIIPQN